MSEKKLFLLDAMALIYRAHFAFSKNPRISSKGMNTGAVLGFANSMLEILHKQQPSHIGVAFDLSGPTFRNEMYPEYKANRQAQPEDITIAIPYVKRLVRAFNIPILEMQNYEADDVIGTLAKKGARAGFEVYMMTPDKDYCQLVEEKIFLYKPAFMGNGVDILGVEKVLEKFKIQKVDQVIDMLGLQGDAVDNIPGIPGIGPKTASKLLGLYDSVEGLLENTDKLKGKQKENVVNFAAQGLLSKELARIDINVPIEFEEDKLKYDSFDQEKVETLFAELEFKTLMKRVMGQTGTAQKTATKSKATTSAPTKSASGQMELFASSPSSTAKPSSSPTPSFEIQPEKETIDSAKHNYWLIDTPEKRKELIHFLSLQNEFCFDTETDSLDALEANLVGIAFSYLKGDAYYVPVPEDFEEAKKIALEFKEILDNDRIVRIGQNLKYDILVLKK
jgi:DNA polymerase-1